MSNKTFAKILAGLSNVSEDACEGVLDAFGEAIKIGLQDDGRIIIKNCMTIEVANRGERAGKDLRTGEAIVYPPTKTVVCKISKPIKDSVK